MDASGLQPAPVKAFRAMPCQRVTRSLRVTVAILFAEKARLAAIASACGSYGLLRSAAVYNQDSISNGFEVAHERRFAI